MVIFLSGALGAIKDNYLNLNETQEIYSVIDRWFMMYLSFRSQIAQSLYFQ